MAKFSKGDVSEGILAAAIACRFLSKTERITSQHVLDLIGKLEKPIAVRGSLVSTTTFESENRSPRIIDDIKVIIGLAPVHMNAFLDLSIYKNKDVLVLLNATVGYANGSHIMEASNTLYENNQHNIIEVISQGLLDQSGTKVDLKIVVDGKQLGVGISLKAGDVKTFGQVGGATTESMKKFFEPLGVKFTSVQLNEFEDLVADKKPTEGLLYIYKEAHKQISAILATNQDKFKEKLSNFVIEHAYRNDPNVAFVHLKKNEAKIYDFRQLKSKLTGIMLEAKYEESTTNVIAGKKIPKIKILMKSSPKGKNSLIELRNKLEGNRINSKGKHVPIYVRNYVEKGNGTTELLISEKYSYV